MTQTQTETRIQTPIEYRYGRVYVCINLIIFNDIAMKLLEEIKEVRKILEGYERFIDKKMNKISDIDFLLGLPDEISEHFVHLKELVKQLVDNALDVDARLCKVEIERREDEKRTLVLYTKRIYRCESR